MYSFPPPLSLSFSLRLASPPCRRRQWCCHCSPCRSPSTLLASIAHSPGLV
ncbi:conserved hypothetical protein [Ricinus communis]|uniref:Uncharacterized protein n=1 Tax=Ricinus communis TaxID=3988 RepID=B9SYB0_RICCO|nr:conserved hypothetical protein [Ricinus communis]